MPKQGQRFEIKAFIKGLITEASPLNFPAEATIDEENFELRKNGTRERRFGMDFEDNYSLINIWRIKNMGNYYSYMRISTKKNNDKRNAWQSNDVSVSDYGCR